MNKPQHSEFDATAALSAVRADRAMQRRRRTWGKSKLVPHRAELVKMCLAGGSYQDLAHWLKTSLRVTVNATTVMRFLNKLPELKNGKS